MSEKKRNGQWILLLLGDLLVILLFALMGRASHQESLYLNEAFGTALPFMIAWLLAGSLMGVYRSEAYETLPKAISKNVIATVVAVPLGIILRSFYLGRGFMIDFSFLIVAFMVQLIMLLVWRSLFTWISKRMRS